MPPLGRGERFWKLMKAFSTKVKRCWAALETATHPCQSVALGSFGCFFFPLHSWANKVKWILHIISSLESLSVVVVFCNIIFTFVFVFPMPNQWCKQCKTVHLNSVHVWAAVFLITLETMPIQILWRSVLSGIPAHISVDWNQGLTINRGGCWVLVVIEEWHQVHRTK